jgi:hypothetical protein
MDNVFASGVEATPLTMPAGLQKGFVGPNTVPGAWSYHSLVMEIVNAINAGAALTGGTAASPALVNQLAAIITASINRHNSTDTNYARLNLEVNNVLASAGIASNTAVSNLLLKALDAKYQREQIIVDRTGATDVLLLDRFDVVHKYRRQGIGTAASMPRMQINTGLVQEAIYKVYCMTESSLLSNFDVTLWPNNTSYSGQFVSHGVSYSSVSSATNRVGNYLSGDNGDTTNSNGAVENAFYFDTFVGGLGYDGVFEMTVFPRRADWYKKVLIQQFDSAGNSQGGGMWRNTTVPWTILGSFGFYTNSNNDPNGVFNFDVIVKRIA